MIFRSARRAAGAVVVAVTVAVLSAGCGSAPAAPPVSARVERATVSTGVSAAGSLSADAQTNLGFPRGGQLTSVRTRVGDVVHAGQILATVDPFAAGQALKQAQSGLDAQRANLARVRDSTGVDGAQSSLDQADRVVAATARQAQATLDADDRAIADAQRSRDRAYAGVAQAQAAFARDEAACQASSASAGATGGTGMSSAGGSGQIACTLLPGDQSGLTMAQSGIGTAESTLSQAQSKRSVDVTSGQLQVENARSGAVSAQNGVDSASTDRPSTVDAAQAAVDGAQVGVANARKDLDNTTLRAPVDGRITALNGAVGEFLAPSSSTTPFAPGGSAPIPGAASGAAAGAGAAAAAGGGASPGRPGGTQFLVMQSVSGFSVVAPFQEIDAANVYPGQHAEVTLDALPDDVLDGTVVSVSPSGTDIADTINYYATIAVTRPDPRLRDGQTARASVITGEAQDMLSVPNTAVTRRGTATSVVVLDPAGREVPTPFSAGLVGANRTEVTAGLTEGQQVLLSGNR